MMKRNGFTLIETLIYIGIFSVVAVSLTGILWNTLSVNSNQQAANEVDENLRYVLSVLDEKVRSSTAIDSAASSTLVLKNSSYANTTFSVTDGVLYLKEGSASPVAVTSNKVKVDALTFTKIDMTGAKGGVAINIVLSYNSSDPKMAFSKNLISTVNRAAAITFDSDILPNTNNLYSIGASNPRWKNGYFSGDVSASGSVSGTTLCIGADCKTSWGQVSGVNGSGATNYVTKWTSSSALGNSLIFDNGTNVGIGTTTPGQKLDVNGTIRSTNGNIVTSNGYIATSNGSVVATKTVTDPTNTSAIAVYGYPTWTGSETVSEYFNGVYSAVYPIVNTGHNNSGYVMGFQGGAFRNFNGASADDSGTLGTLSGMTIQLGHYNQNTAATPVTTNVYGVRIVPYYYTGTITNYYDLYLQAGASGGTITNRYGIYQEATTATNYFGGKVGVGTNSPAAKLDIGGTTASTLQAVLARGASDGNFRLAVYNGSGSAVSTEHAWLGMTYGATKLAGISFLRGAGSNASMQFQTGTAATTAMTIDLSNNVGIGTTVPGQKLEVAGNIKLNTGAIISAGSTKTYGALDIWGKKGNYSGINFFDGAGAYESSFLVDADGSTGMYLEGTGWQWAFNSSGALTTGSVPWSKLSSLPAFAANAASGRVRMYEVGCGSSWGTSCDTMQNGLVAGSDGYLDIANYATNADTVDGYHASLVAFRFANRTTCPAVSGLTLRGAMGSYDNGTNYIGTDCTTSGTPKCICFYSSM